MELLITDVRLKNGLIQTTFVWEQLSISIRYENTNQLNYAFEAYKRYYGDLGFSSREQEIIEKAIKDALEAEQRQLLLF